MAYADSKAALLALLRDDAAPRSIDPSEIGAAIAAVTDDLDADIATKVAAGQNLDNLVDSATRLAMQPAERAKLAAIDENALLAFDPFKTAAGHKALAWLDGREGFCIDGIGRSAAINDYAGAKSALGRPSQLLTFSRASVAAYVDSDRLRKFAAVDVLRYTHDPVTGVLLGILRENAATNLCLRSQELDNASWTKSNATVTANGALGPDGVMSLDKAVENSATASHLVRQAIAFTPSTTYAIAIFARAAERSVFTLLASDTTLTRSANFDLAAGTVTAGGTGLAGSQYIEDWGGGLYRCVLIVTFGGSVGVGSYFDCRLSDGGALGGLGDTYLGDGTSGLYLGYAQVETGDRASSYVVTTTASVLRAADAIPMPTSAMPGDASVRGTLFVEFSLTAPVGSQRLIDVRTDTSNIVVIGSGSNAAQLRCDATAGGVSQASLVLTAGMVAGATYRAAASYRANDFAASLNGAAVVTDTAGAVPAVTTLNIGAGANCIIKRAAWLARDLTDAETMALAA